MRFKIPFIHLIDKVGMMYNLDHPESKVICDLFKGNISTLTLTNNYKYRPKIKCIALKKVSFKVICQDREGINSTICAKEQLSD
jgi:hypothetical protein